MKNMKFLILIIIIILVGSTTVFSASTTDPARLYYGARPLGLGGAFTAIANDGNAMFTNPAGISLFKYPEFSGMSRSLFFEESLYSVGSYTIPTDWGSFGVGIIDASIGGSYQTMRDPATGRITIDPSGEATAYDNNVVFLAYGKEIWQGFSVGLNYKLYNQSITGGQNIRGTATNADFGILYRPQNIAWLTLGLNYQNLMGAKLKWDDISNTEDDIGSTLKIGTAFSILGTNEALYQHDSQKLILAIDFDSISSTVLSNQTSDLKLGIEYYPIDSLALRIGTDSNLGTALGVGIEKKGFRFDYAYLQNKDVTGNNPHYFSLAFTLYPEFKIFKPLEFIIPYIKMVPKDKSITPELSLAIKGMARQINKTGKMVTTTEVVATDEPVILPEVNPSPLVAPTSIESVASVESTATLETTAKATYNQLHTKLITKEVFMPTSIEVTTIDGLIDLTLNGNSMPYTAYGSFETSVKLELGRNVLLVEALATPESIAAKNLARVLRYTPFNDTYEKHWAIRPIAFMSSFGIINGYPDNTYKPERTITRAELVTLLMKTKPYEIDLSTAEVVFKDVKASHWAATYIEMAANSGLVLGYPDGTFKPKKPITRAEGVTVLTRFAEIEQARVVDLVPFPDLKEDYWANQYISKAKAVGMLDYLVKQNFDPNTAFTRAEAAEVLYRTPIIQKKVDRFWETGDTSSYTEEMEPSEIITTEATEPITVEVETTAPTLETITSTEESIEPTEENFQPDEVATPETVVPVEPEEITTPTEINTETELTTTESSTPPPILNVSEPRF